MSIYAIDLALHKVGSV